MTVGEALIQGAVQGLTEFLPVSSSGHLAIAAHVFKMSEGAGALTFTILLHLATLVPIIVFFWDDVREVISGQSRVLGLIVAGTLPLVVMGFFLAPRLDRMGDDMTFVAGALIVTALFLISTEVFGTERRALGMITISDALIIGFAQSLAIAPGLSRSGLTIATAIILGIKRRDAIRFAFLLGIPAILGAAGYEILAAGEPSVEMGFLPVAIGFISALVMGGFSLWLLVKIVKARRMPFIAIYLFAVAALALLGTP